MIKFKTLSYLFILSLIIILSGCEKKINYSDTNSIPSDFDYSLTKDIDITVKVDDKYDGQYYYKVEIFDSDPTDPDANLISKGLANPEQPYVATVTILKTITYLYIRKTSYTEKETETKTVKTSEDNISVDFGTSVTSIKTKSSTTTDVYADMFKNGNYKSWLTTTYSYNVYTYLFEDGWPNLGDYDMNDIVMNVQRIRYKKYTNNFIENMELQVVLRAAGGVFKIGGAIQLDGIASEDISSISGESEDNLAGEIFNRNSNGTESNQTYAVIPLFDETHAALGTSLTITNTITGLKISTKAVKTISLTINFKENTVSSSDLSMKKLNVFMVHYGDNIVYKDGVNKRKEIHLAGYAPTDLGTTSLFGTGDDNSSISDVSSLYKSTTNLIWGLAVPGATISGSFIFKYPSENIEITKAYPEFNTWTTSGGKTNTDWYKNPDSESIY